MALAVVEILNKKFPFKVVLHPENAACHQKYHLQELRRYSQRISVREGIQQNQPPKEAKTLMEAKKSRLKPKIMFYEILYGKTPTLSDVEKLPPVGEVIKKVAAKEPALLSERYQEILRLRYIEGEKLAHIAGEYGVSKQRIDQLCTNITDKIRLILMMYN